jgi:hypothetical protein
MSDGSGEGIPPGARSIIEALTRQAIARCHRLGIDPADFYRALLEEQKIDPKSSVSNLFERTFHRLEGLAN